MSNINRIIRAALLDCSSVNTLNSEQRKDLLIKILTLYLQNRLGGKYHI